MLTESNHAASAARQCACGLHGVVELVDPDCDLFDEMATCLG
jgi:hypothetical protein